MEFTKFAQVLEGLNNLYVPTEDLEEKIAHTSINVVIVASIALTVLVLLAALLRKKNEKVKKPLFLLIAGTMIGSTLFLAGSTVYLNVKSDSKGPVHWHADTEIWACDSEVELRDPTGFLSNKIGTSTLHEHDDQRIHLEGVVVDDKLDASLGKYFYVIGGAITDEAMVVPLNAPEKGDYFEDHEDGDGKNPADISVITNNIIQGDDGPYLRYENGDTCNGEESEVQVFVYSINDGEKTYTQTKLENPRDYVITDDPNVPPGDCIIFEFSPSKTRTNHICEQYGIRDANLCDKFQSKEALCEYREVDANGNDVDYSVTRVETPSSDNDASQTSTPVDDDIDAQAVADSDEINALCKQYFNEDGTPTNIEPAAFKSNGEQLIVETDCEEYRQELLGNPASLENPDTVSNTEEETEQ